MRTISQIPDGIPHLHPIQTRTEANELKYNHLVLQRQRAAAVSSVPSRIQRTLHHHRACGLLCVHHPGSAELFQETLGIFQAHSHSYYHTPEQQRGYCHTKSRVKDQ